MRPEAVVLEGRASAVVLTCEHASAAVPPEIDLEVPPAVLRDHYGWDIGAGTLTRRLAARLEASAVLATVSRLVVDCNRAPDAPDAVPAVTHGVRVPGNEGLPAAGRAARLARYYWPFHEAVDALLDARRPELLVSVHSFTPVLDGQPRPFDVGVLFDAYPEVAERLAAGLAAAGLRVRLNEPYSGLDGLIYSAQVHGRRAGVRYVEVEVNNRLLRTAAGVEAVAERLGSALAALVQRERRRCA